MRHVPLEDALRLVHLNAEKESPKVREGSDALAWRYLADYHGGTVSSLLAVIVRARRVNLV